MNANELRIGNLVTSVIRLEGSLIEKCRVEGNILIVNKDFLFHDLSEKCEGIPLTEKWLLKFGFKYEDEDGSATYYRDEYKNEIVKDGNSYMFLWPSRYVGEIDIKYVHQLQNLYFALTGEELSINSQIQSQTS